MEADYELIDNEERRQYEFHVEKYTPKIEYMKSYPFSVQRFT